MVQQVYGVTNNDDLSPGILKKDTRPFRVKLKDFIRDESSLVIQVAGLFLIGLSFYPGSPLFQDWALFAAIIVYIIHRKIDFSCDFSTPATVRGTNDGGMFFLSNNLYTGNTEGWIHRDLSVTHWLVFGSTGSGKTRFLLGLFYQVAMYGGGCIYVDGKGDNTVWWLFYSMARKVGREEDVLLMSYLTGGGSAGSKRRISNTCNPFTMGNANQLASIVVGLMRDGGGDDMWKGRAIAMLKSLMHALVDKRDRNEIELNIEEIRNHMSLDKIMAIAQDDKLEEEASKNIMHYLEELPGFRVDDMHAGKLNAECYKQHGFLQMQLTEVMGDLSSTYKHIYGGKYGEIDFTDVVFNKRLLFVILPALEKNPDELAGLGKMVVSNIRGALAPALGVDVEGNKVDVLDSKPTNAEIPFTIILDEYGYYSVEGFAVVAAQARSLGVQVVYAGQDYPSLKKGSEIEAQATVANTNIKIAMKIEDLQETADVFVNRAGESDITMKSGDEQTHGLMGGYKEQDNTRIERRKRIDGRDLVNQAPGQAHVLIKDTLERVQLFYADPLQTENIRLNRFIPTRRISNEDIKDIEASKRMIDVAYREPESLEKYDNKDQVIPNIFKWSRIARDHNMTLEDSMRYSLGANLSLLTVDDVDREKELTPDPEVSQAKESVDTVNKAPVHQEVISGSDDQQREEGKEEASQNNSSSNGLASLNEYDDQATEVSELVDEKRTDKISDLASQAEANFVDALESALKSSENNSSSINKDARNNMKAISGISKKYPTTPPPEMPKQEELEKHLKWIMNHFNKDEESEKV